MTIARKWFWFPVLIIINVTLFETRSHSGQCSALFRMPPAPVTARQAMAQAESRILLVQKYIEPPVDNSLLSKSLNRERFGEPGPRAFDYFLPKDAAYFSAPGPNAEHHTMATRLVSSGNGSLRVRVPWINEFGKKVWLTTDLFYNVPFGPSVERDGTPKPKSDYLIGEDFEYVVLQLHGGGTPSAEAQNASSKGEFFVKRDTPVLSLTLPGHGHATDLALATGEEILSLIRAILEKYVHPKVKFAISGHSWGGQFTLAAQRLFKDDRFVGFFAESPVIDITLGGDWRKRFEWEANFWRKVIAISQGLELDPENLLARISPKDLEFLRNIETNGKLSPRAAFVTGISALDYSTRILPKEVRDQLKPLVVYMGAHDALVFVGREREGLKYFLRSGDLVLMREGKTFRGDIKAGHQIHDITIADESGKQVHLVAMDQLNRIRKLGYENQKPEHSSVLMDMLFSAWQKYQNNFAFREYLNTIRTHIRRKSPVAEQKSRELAEHENALLRFKKLKEDLEGERQMAIREMVTQFAKDHGIVVRKDLGAQGDYQASLSSALAELSVNRSDARKKEILAYIELVRKKRDQMDLPIDQIQDENLRQIRKGLDAILQENLKKVEVQVREKYPKGSPDNYLQTGHRFFRSEELSSLSRKASSPGINLEQKALEYGFSSLRAAEEFYLDLSQKLQKKKSFDPVEREVLVAIEFSAQKYKECYREQARIFGQTIERIIRDLPAPSGILNLEVAKWELMIQNYDSETLKRRYGASEESVHHFVENLPIALSALNEKWDFHILQSQREFKWPNDGQLRLSLRQILGRSLSTTQKDMADEIAFLVEMAKNKTQDLNALVGDDWRPEGSQNGVYAKLIRTMRALESRISEIHSQQQTVKNQLDELWRMREKHLRFLISEVPTEENPKAQSFIHYESHEVEVASAQFGEKLRQYKAIYDEYSIAMEKYQMDAYEDAQKIPIQAGRELFLKKRYTYLPKYFIDFAKRYRQAEKEFFLARKNLRKTRLIAIANGKASTQKDPTGEKMRVSILALYGSVEALQTEVLSPGGSLEAQLRDKLKVLDQLNEERVKIQKRYDLARYQYYRHQPEDVRIYEMHSYKWSAILNQPLFAKPLLGSKGSQKDLWSWFHHPIYGSLRVEAFTNMMREWDDMWKDAVLSEQNWAQFEWTKAPIRIYSDSPLKIDFP